MSDKYYVVCPMCAGTGLHTENSIIGCNWCLGRGGFDSVFADEYHAACAATDRKKSATTQHVEVGQTWYVQLYERATLTKWWVTDLTDKTIELSKDQPAWHPPVVYRYRRDEVRLVERVS